MNPSVEFSGISNLDRSLHQRISRSASELSNFDPNWDKHGRYSVGLSVKQKTCGFFSHLKNKFSVKIREKGLASREVINEVSVSRSNHSSPKRKNHKLVNCKQSVFDSIEDNNFTIHTSNPIVFEKMYTKSADNILSNNLKNDNQHLREEVLNQHSAFILRIHLKCASNLLAMDKNGTSDPYVKFKYNGKLMYKSKIIYRDLNPQWNEHFSIHVDDRSKPIYIKVFDYDFAFQDDFLGSTVLDLKPLEPDKTMDFNLNLQDSNKPEYQLGCIHFTATIVPAANNDDIVSQVHRSFRSNDVKKLKSQIWSSVVNIILIESHNLPVTDFVRQSSDTYLRLKLGAEKFKSKVAWRSINPRWLEQCDFHLYDDCDQKLEITLWSKVKSRHEIIGRCYLNLKNMKREETHVLTRNFEECTATINLLLTISGTTASETISDLTNHEDSVLDYKSLSSRYIWHKTLDNVKDVGHLIVKVYEAKGLASADICGKSDPFCVIELGNARLQTQTEYKTLSPCWNKIFTFNVKDINNVLEITVFDEDRDHRVEFLGKVIVPLLTVNNFEKKWHLLKNKKLRKCAKGTNPQILLEMIVIWNPYRAAIRTLNPKEVKYMESEMKFKREIFTRNVLRVKNIVLWLIEISKIFQDCFEWESKTTSFLTLILWLLLCYIFQIWMIPTFFLTIFLKKYVILRITNSHSSMSSNRDDLLKEDDLDDDDDDDKQKEGKKTLKGKLQTVQDVTQSVQNYIGKIASFGESAKNLFNFTVPYLSALAIILLLVSSIVLYFVPVKYLLMLWGLNKFFRRILRPHAVPNNEILDLLSRVPDDEMLLDYSVISCVTPTVSDKKKEK